VAPAVPAAREDRAAREEAAAPAVLEVPVAREVPAVREETVRAVREVREETADPAAVASVPIFLTSRNHLVPFCSSSGLSP